MSPSNSGLLLFQKLHAKSLMYAVLSSVSKSYPPLLARLLMFYSPVRHWTSDRKIEPSTLRSLVPFDLHVLGAPPAFVLSQDQTLYNMLALLFRIIFTGLSRYLIFKVLSLFRVFLILSPPPFFVNSFSRFFLDFFFFLDLFFLHPLSSLSFSFENYTLILFVCRIFSLHK